MGTSKRKMKSFDLANVDLGRKGNIRIIDLSGHTETVEGEVHYSPGVAASAIDSDTSNPVFQHLVFSVFLTLSVGSALAMTWL